jgi:plastocyanin
LLQLHVGEHPARAAAARLGGPNRPVSSETTLPASFAVPGSYSFVCTIHPSMATTVIVSVKKPR